MTGSVAAGEDATTAALLDATLAALALLDGTAPAILRLPVSPTGAYERAAMLIARTWDPPEQLHRERRCALHCRWDALASAGLYLAGYDTQRRNAWGERVVALAIAEGFDPPDNPDASCPVCFEDFSSDLPTPDELRRAHRRGDGLVGMPLTLVYTTPSAEGVIWSCNQTHDLRSVGAPSAGVHACASCTADVQRCTHCNVVTETAVTDDCLYAMHAYCAHVNTRTLGPPGSHTLYSSQPCSCA